MEKLIATARFKHNGKWLVPGDEITDVTEEDKADLLSKAVGLAELKLMGMADALERAATAMRPTPRRMGYTRRDSPKVSEDEKV